ncbi:hypothetical protein EM868_23815 [Cupriavidus gilardii]|uniref:hypothetical protein n=1 Tax=Cupriavidus gilardii TaxID=82541 RepID=UPI001EE5E9C5|nr:hypothetical protein [Cupriavidus gilardii]MCG5259432.1 hypothetical protein [Cupriavidus gilardii]MDF9432781.1 hypothetical protein [Cupriavidus gilardii]
MPDHHFGRTTAAMPAQANLPGANHVAGAATAPAGTLLTPAQASSVSLVAARSGAATDLRWSLLAVPMKQIAGYLSLHDRIALARASHAVRDALGQLAATTLERAWQVSTLSGLSAVLGRIDAMPDVNDRASVLKALARRTRCLARPHRRRAWRRILQACDALPVAARASVLTDLSCVPSVARVPQLVRNPALGAGDVEDCLAMLDQRLNALPAAGRAALTFALLRVREPQRGGKLYVKLPPRVRFDLAGHLALVPLLPAAGQRDATKLAVGYHLRSPGTPLELWRGGIAAACAAGQASISAWTLVALMEARTVEGPRLLSALEAPQLAWQQAIERARKLPAAEAASVGVGLAQCLKAGWAAASFRTQGVDALWQLGLDLRLDIDQRAEMLAPWGLWLPRQKWEALWHELLERCATEGMTQARRRCLERFVETAPGAHHAPRGKAAWDTTVAAIETALMRKDPGDATPEPGTSRRADGAASLGAALCSILANKWLAPAPQQGATALDRLLGCIDRLPPVWRGQPLRDLLAWVNHQLHAGIVVPRLPALAPLDRATLLAGLLQVEPGLRPSTTMQDFLDALKAAGPLMDEGCAVLAQVLHGMRERPEMLRSDWLTLAADLPTWAGQIDLATQPRLALEYAKLAIAMRWQSSRELPDSVQARLFRNVGDFLTASVKGLPMEVRKTVLLELGQGPSAQLQALDSMNASTEWILSLAESLPPAYRVDVLCGWAEADTFRNSVAAVLPMMALQERDGAYGWQPRRPVWQAILRMPPEYLAPPLCATTDWFVDVRSATPYWASRDDDDFRAAEAQWRQALQRLPDADQVEVRFLAMPQLAVMMDGMAANMMRLLERI